MYVYTVCIRPHTQCVAARKKEQKNTSVKTVPRRDGGEESVKNAEFLSLSQQCSECYPGIYLRIQEMVALGTHSTHLLKLEKRDFLTECDLAAWFLSIRTGFAIKVLLVVIFH